MRVPVFSIYTLVRVLNSTLEGLDRVSEIVCPAIRSRSPSLLIPTGNDRRRKMSANTKATPKKIKTSKRTSRTPMGALEKLAYLSDNTEMNNAATNHCQKGTIGFNSA